MLVVAPVVLIAESLVAIIPETVVVMERILHIEQINERISAFGADKQILIGKTEIKTVFFRFTHWVLSFTALKTFNFPYYTTLLAVFHPIIINLITESLFYQIFEGF